MNRDKTSPMTTVRLASEFSLSRDPSDCILTGVSCPSNEASQFIRSLSKNKDKGTSLEGSRICLPSNCL